MVLSLGGLPVVEFILLRRVVPQPQGSRWYCLGCESSRGLTVVEFILLRRVVPQPKGSHRTTSLCLKYFPRGKY